MVFSGLEEGTEYVYTVRAATKQGSGPWSENTSFMTSKEMVRAPMGLKAMATSDQSIEVWWEPIPLMRHKLYGYHVRIYTLLLLLFKNRDAMLLVVSVHIKTSI